jgi:NADPH2:quinone reductase
VDAALDGATLNELILPAIRDGGGLAVVRGWDGPADRGIHVHPVRVTEAATDHARLLRLRDQASTGELTLRVADVLPADQAAQAHRRLAEGGVRGRLVLDFTAF